MEHVIKNYSKDKAGNIYVELYAESGYILKDLRDYSYHSKVNVELDDIKYFIATPRDESTDDENVCIELYKDDISIVLDALCMYRDMCSILEQDDKYNESKEIINDICIQSEKNAEFYGYGVCRRDEY